VLVWIKGAGGSITYGCDANRNATLNETAILDTIEIGSKEYARYVSTDGQDIPMHICSPYMLAAYAGFAGLRPMTEFEYEKACRGPIDAKTNEYAWGSSEGTSGDYMMVEGRWDVAGGDVSSTYKNINKGNERLASTVSGFGIGGINIVFNNNNPGWWNCTNGASHRYRQAQLVRVGAFADTNTSRQGAGASYWGIMNLSDNAYEYVVLATNSAGGLKYNGEHGNGVLLFEGGNAYPDGRNSWRLPANGAGWYSLRGIFNYTLAVESRDRSAGWWNCGTTQLGPRQDLGL
jgi:hypothetical protein